MEEKIKLGHGSGGKLTGELIEEVFLKAFKNELLTPLLDSAVFQIGNLKLAFTTDSFTVNPLFFRGGDVGKLAVSGTVNDLLVVGAKPLFISTAFIIEEGFSSEALKRIVESMEKIAEESNIKIITGDTKVVEKGKADGVYINTSGIGIIVDGVEVSYERIKPGDKIIITGTVGEHEASVIIGRGELGIAGEIESDCAPLTDLLLPIMKKFGPHIKIMRDPTRGGVAATLNEIARKSGQSFIVEEEKVPVMEGVRVFCEMLGFDPLYMANEGKAILIVDKTSAERILDEIKRHPLGENASIIGEVIGDRDALVYLKTPYGGTRILDLPVEGQFPRIC